jgi:outer membrane receptor for ferrienterochelin and colicin
MTSRKIKAYVFIVTLTLAASAGAWAAGEEAPKESQAEDVNVEFRWDADGLFLNLEAGETRAKFDSETGDYELYIPEDPDGDDPYFRENDLRIRVDGGEDRTTITARGDKETIRKKLDEIVEGDLREFEEGEADGIRIKELDDGYEITIEGKRGSAGKIEEEYD